VQHRKFVAGRIVDDQPAMSARPLKAALEKL
jgi:hypothetical protein